MATTKSKRALSAFNLYYRYKRSKILNASSSIKWDKEAIENFVAAVSGLEHLSNSELKCLRPKDAFEISRDIIRKELQDNLLPFDGKRAHRKTHGVLDFVEMGRIMSKHWKLVSVEIRIIFQELADEGKELSRQRLSKSKSKEETEMLGVSAAGSPDEFQFQFLEETATQTMRSAAPTEMIKVNNGVTARSTGRSQSPMRQRKANIVSPATSAIFSTFENEAHHESETEEDGSAIEDEFCAFIDKNIHLVSDHELDMFERRSFLQSKFQLEARGDNLANKNLHELAGVENEIEQRKFNIVSPSTSAVFKYFASDNAADNKTGAHEDRFAKDDKFCDDEFRTFISQNIHLVDTSELDAFEKTQVRNIGS